jgi:cell division protein FtsZ
MSSAMILYVSGISLIIVVFGIYAIIQKMKFALQNRADDMVNKIRKENQTQIEHLEKKLDQFYISCKLETLCFIGIGGGGCNIVEDISQIDKWHKFIHINSDLQALQLKTSKDKILLGYNKKEGLGCGGVAECGAQLINSSSKKQLFKSIKSFEKVYVIATLGGGVGSGATSGIVEYLNSLDKEVYVFVTMPFSFEGKTRKSVAQSALGSIQDVSSNVIIMNNDDLIKKNAEEELGTRETFKLSSQIIYKQIVTSFRC